MAIEVTGLCPLIQVHDMSEAIAFYCSKLGFDIVAASPEVETPEGRFSHWMWLRLGSADLMLNTAYDEGERPAERNPERQHWHDDTALYFGCVDADAIYAELRARGVAVTPPQTAPYGMRQLLARDPDGYQLCFQHRV